MSSCHTLATIAPVATYNEPVLKKHNELGDITMLSVQQNFVAIKRWTTLAIKEGLASGYNNKNKVQVHLGDKL